MTVLYLTVALTLVLLAGLYLVVRRLSTDVAALRVDAEWWDHFSADRYLPLSHLVNGSEFSYLATLPGYEPSVGRRFRSARAGICRDYLNEMKRDFTQLQAVGQAFVTAGKCGPEFREQLLRQRTRFTVAWWRVRLQLAFWECGFGSVDPAELLDTMERSAASIQLVLAPTA